MEYLLIGLFIANVIIMGKFLITVFTDVPFNNECCDECTKNNKLRDKQIGE